MIEICLFGEHARRTCRYEQTRWCLTQTNECAPSERLGWQAGISLEDGLTEAFRWILDNQDKSRAWPMYLDEQTFKTVFLSAPLVSIDLVVKNSDGQCLFGRRTNPPALGYWFVPGGRVQKNETLSVAFSRLCYDELGTEKSLAQARFLGAYEHFYPDSIFGDEKVHFTVNGICSCNTPQLT